MCKVAVLESDDVLREQIAERLAARGYTVSEHCDLGGAKLSLVEGAPDLVVVADDLPGGDALEVVAHLREVHPLEFPILVLTSSGEEETYKRAFVAGATDCLSKPVVAAELLAKCEVHLSRAAAATTRKVRLGLPRSDDGLTFRRYRVHGLSGTGSSSRVYLAEDAQTGRDVALKVLSAVGGDDTRLRFLREIYALAAIDHPQIVRIHDFGAFEGRLYYAMDAVEGPTLRQVIKAQGPATIAQARQLLHGLASALAELHLAGLLHRDLSPHNVILRGGRWDDPVLIDFGLAKREYDHGLTDNDMLMGTPGYVDPLLLFEDQPTHSSDLFSLGMVARFALVAEEPFPNRRGLAVIHAMHKESAPFPDDLPGGLRALLESMTSIHADLRPRSAEEVLHSLRHCHLQSHPRMLPMTWSA